jgi:DNA-binding NtrC family response regulator
MVARSIHDLSDRRAEPMVAVNCAAIPSALLESMLFGHERGAFTGAERRSPGRFAAARSGTILLDEIGEMPLDLQAKFLRVLEDARYLPVGAEQEVELRARVVASTNVDLAARVADGRFRSDLFYRLDVVTIRLPPMSQRVEDIEELVVALNDALPRRLRYTPKAIEWLAHRPWPGNVRELKNVLRRLSVMAEDDLVDVATLVELVPPTGAADAQSILARLVDAALDAPDDGRSRQQLLDRLLVERAIARCGGNKSAAARLVGLPRKVFTRRLELFAANPDASTVEDDD